jgi:hypothetical protein
VNALEVLGQATAPDGTDLKLTRRGNEYIILANGKSLMSSRMHGSEEALATLSCRRSQTLEEPCVLVGGLGMGFTLRATLDLLPKSAIVVVAELMPAVVDWNRGPLGPLAGHPLKDKRVRVELQDVAVTLRSNPGRFDAVLLDVDNGPAAFTSADNTRLYSDAGLAALPHRTPSRWSARRLVCTGRSENLNNAFATRDSTWRWSVCAPGSRRVAPITSSLLLCPLVRSSQAALQNQNFEIGQILHLRSEIRNLKLHCPPAEDCRPI